MGVRAVAAGEQVNGFTWDGENGSNVVEPVLLANSETPASRDQQGRAIAQG